MDVLEYLGELNTALVILSFLQEEHKSAEYRDELLLLAQHVSPPRAVELHGCPDASLDDGYLETDGSSPQIPPCLRGALPAVALPRPDAAAVQQAAEELREVAAQLEHQVVAEATQNLRRNLLSSTSDTWEDHLSREVSRVMRHSVALKDVAQEHMAVALTLTLVKGVCEQTPPLLRDLFAATMRYIARSRRG